MRGEREFRKVRAHGAAVRDPLFTLRLTDYRPRYGEAWRPRALMGLVVSKKTLKRAVDRNRARRRVREALRTMPPELLPGGLPACRAIVMLNPGVLGVPFAELQAALARALVRGGGQLGRSGGKRGNRGGTGRVPSGVNAASFGTAAPGQESP
ncbi:MAG: ribonuclease P protein component [Deinococcus sp.]|uniref:ribonuclease P protein component n=1 Tax=Deinococcus sp. TaxID=47478 RepID=UPI0026DDAFEF|nr:ribonuclease P protein component [Deinococcus sp.]MDO4247327.1 ribonuclease P protein component [Deinococcus sp.]